MRRKSLLAFLDRFCEVNVENSIISVSSVEVLSENIRENLENLLNTRRSFLPFNPRYKELNQSSLNYGIDDFFNLSMDSSETLDQFCQHIQQVIVLFEPRLNNVTVTLESDSEQLVRSLSLRIEAELRGDVEYHLVSYHAAIKSTDPFLNLKTSKMMEALDAR